MTLMSVDVPERFVRRLSKVKGRESKEGRDNNHVNLCINFLLSMRSTVAMESKEANQYG